MKYEYAVWIMGYHLNLDIFNIQNPDHHVLDFVRCYPVCFVNLCIVSLSKNAQGLMYNFVCLLFLGKS
jgi:hypothetical protein